MHELNTILTVRNFSAGFNNKLETIQAVNNISFSLGMGETIGIVGESGSGKSVTALSMLQLLNKNSSFQASGEILYHHLKNGMETQVNLALLSDKDIRKLRGKEIAMIFQDPMTSLNPVLTCGRQVSETIKAHFKNISRKEALKKTLELFDKVMLQEPERIYKSYPFQVSGGQKQRVAIAMAISCDPAVLIADEPTTALDVTVQAAILDLLKKLQSETNMSIIFISHNLGVIAEMASRVMVMYKGKFVETGSVKEIFETPKHPYTMGLLACRPMMGPKLRMLPVISNFMYLDDHGDVQPTKETIFTVREKLMVSEEEERLHQQQIYFQKPVLTIKDLNTWFLDKQGLFGTKKKYLKAVENISFEVFEGETVGLAGESGCGKTTLGKTIARLIEPYSGKVIFKDKDLFHLNKSEMLQMRKKLQIIFQDPYSSLNPSITIGEAILETMRVHHLHADDLARKREVGALLESVNLNESHFNRFPHEFSGGQRQRIAIARALAVRPEFLICDESVSALDVSVQAQVLNLLNKLKKEYKLSYLFISHDLSVIKFMSDRLIIMNNGKIEEIGKPDDIFKNPVSAYTKKLLASVPKGL